MEININEKEDIYLFNGSDNDLVDAIEAEAKITNETLSDLNAERDMVNMKLDGRKWKWETFPVCRLNGKPISKEQLYNLLKVHCHRKQNGFYHCKHCEHSTKLSIAHMMEHTQKHIQNLEFDCDTCGKIFQETKALRGHKAKHHPVFCRINGKPITKYQLSELQEENYNKQGKIYQCNHCKYNTKNRGEMRIHTHCHIDFLEFDCDICGKTAPGIHALRSHKHRQHSESPEDALVCKTCNIQFTTQYFKN